GSVTAGAIASAQTICSGDTPAAFTSTTVATGTGGVSYQWQSSTDNSSFNDISGETSATYTPSSGITQDTWYRRKATSTTGSCFAYTTSVKVTVNSSPTINYTLTSPTICSGGTATITMSGSESGVSYQLRNNSDDSNVGSPVSGTGNSIDFSVTPSANTTYNIYATTGSNCSAELTNTSTVTINTVAGGTIATAQTICTGSDPSAFTSSTDGSGSGTITYAWEESTDGSTFTSISNINASLEDDSYVQAGSNSATTHGSETTVIVKNSGSNDNYTREGVLKFNIANVTNGVANARLRLYVESYNNEPVPSQTSAVIQAFGSSSDSWTEGAVAWNSKPATSGGALDEVTISTSGVGQYFEWDVTSFVSSQLSGNDYVTFVLKSKNNDQFMVRFESDENSGSNAPQLVITENNNASTFDPPVLTSDRWYKRITTSTLNGVACTAESNSIRVTVNNIDGGSIGSDQTVCSGSTPSGLTNSSSATGDGTITYQWQSSTTSASAGFSNVSGATSAAYSPVSLTQNTWYKRVATSTLNSVACTAESNVVAITVNALPTATAGVSSSPICVGSTISLTETGGDGTSWSWTGPDSFTSTSQNPSISNATVANTGTYTVTVTNGNSCSSISNVTVTVMDVEGGTIGSDQTICSGTSPSSLTNIEDGLLAVGDNLISNGSFELPDVSGNNVYADSSVDGWNSSSGSIEIWDSGSVSGIPSFEGNQLMELNANGPNTVYQDVTTVPGTVMTWKIMHRGRSGTDEAKLKLGAPGSTSDIQTFSTGTSWVEYTGSYTVPSGQTTTRFEIVSVTTGGAANLIDDVQFFATNSSGTISYQWQSSTTSASAGFSNVSGATSSTYSPGALSQSTWYKRVASSTVGGNTCSSESNVVAITVNSLPTPTFTAEVTSACAGSTGNVYTTQSGMSNYIWVVSAGGTITSGGGISDNSVTITWNTGGAQTVSVNYTDGNGCTASSAVTSNVTVNSLNLVLYDVTNANNVNTSTDTSEQSQCPELANGFNGNTASYNAGATQLIYRVDMAGNSGAWQFTFTLSGTDVTVNSFVSYTGVGGSGTVTATGTGNARTISVPSGNTGVLIYVNITNQPGSSLSVVGTVSAGSSGSCNETGSTDDNARTHIISKMPDIGSIN
ncbi:DNRLRE domain-containing protein, partial [Prolixibacteraceae bacterium JC049]|nr:DNRLRE domain-containing protein [Prolixibacteraceae bacterium JC049]